MSVVEVQASISGPKRVEATVRQIQVAASVRAIGPQGLPGVGVPDGGTDGEVLVRTTIGAEWKTFEGADKTFTTNFTNQSQVSITHNLGKYPAVTVFDSADDQVFGEVNYVDQNTVALTFSGSFSGQVTCN